MKRLPLAKNSIGVSLIKCGIRPRFIDNPLNNFHRGRIEFQFAPNGVGDPTKIS
jgi:hypothetical protein